MDHTPTQIIQTYFKLDDHMPNVLNNIVIGYLFDEDMSNRCTAITKKNVRCKKPKLDLYLLKTHMISKIPTDNCYVHRKPEHKDLTRYC